MQTLFEQFDLSVNGFLPSEPVPKLNNSFAAWENMADNLALANTNKITRWRVSQLPDFPSQILTNDQQFRRAYTILSMITNSYIFNESPPADVIPAKLARPLWSVSAWLGIKPILTHAAVDLYNWKLVDSSKPITLDNLKSTTLITGTEDEERFYLVMVACEAIGGQILKAIVELDRDNASEKLEIIRKGLVEINKVLPRMYEKCKPEVFWKQLRPYLSGSENNDKLPNGLKYEGIEVERQFIAGGSAAQSSLFASIDAAFDVNHLDTYFQKIQEYMPVKHKLFIAYIKENAQIKKKIDGSDEAVTAAFDECIQQLRLFRSGHFKFAQKYIIDQLKKERSDQVVDTSSDEATGTGGTSLKKFLQQAIDETI